MEGNSVGIYERIKLFMTTEVIMGQLICNEMKLKGDIVFNVNTKKVRGFTEDFANARRSVTNLLDDEDVESYSKPATYVNQWGFRSVDGKTYNLEFWFDFGKLKGEDLLRQFFQVFMR